MKYCVIFTPLLFLFFSGCDRLDLTQEPETVASETYFPPKSGVEWTTLDIDSLNWNKEALNPLVEFLRESDTRAFIILKEGKLVVEEYFGKGLLNQDFDRNSNWYWASAAKSMTSFLVGQAQAESLLDIDNPVSDYLGKGWTSLNPDQEIKIKVRHQLSMTSGLDDIPSPHCTDPECLTFKEYAGSRWAYHNGPYTLLDQVLEAATQKTFDSFFESSLKEKIGMDGFWMYQGYNHLYFSTARSMARFGLLMLNNGIWKDENLIADHQYLVNSISSSQTINPSYGYLWWLNGKENYMLPQSQLLFQGSLTPSAPSDMFSAIGKNSQLISIVPSQNIVVIRMGGDPDESLVPTFFINMLWNHLNKLMQL